MNKQAPMEFQLRFCKLQYLDFLSLGIHSVKLIGIHTVTEVITLTTLLAVIEIETIFDNDVPSADQYFLT